WLRADPNADLSAGLITTVGRLSRRAGMGARWLVALALLGAGETAVRGDDPEEVAARAFDRPSSESRSRATPARQASRLSPGICTPLTYRTRAWSILGASPTSKGCFCKRRRRRTPGWGTSRASPLSGES